MPFRWCRVEIIRIRCRKPPKQRWQSNIPMFNQDPHKNYGTSPFLMGRSTINCHVQWQTVSFPEGKYPQKMVKVCKSSVLWGKTAFSLQKKRQSQKSPVAMALFRPAGVNSAGTLFPKGIGPAWPAATMASASKARIRWQVSMEKNMNIIMGEIMGMNMIIIFIIN